MDKKILEQINASGWLDNQDIQYYIEATGLPVTQELIELIIENQKSMQNIEQAVNLAAGIIKHKNFKTPLEAIIEQATPFNLQDKAEEAYMKHIETGCDPDTAADRALEALWD